MADCKEVRSHYEQAAENRDLRLRSAKLNAAQVNHRIRARVISAFLNRVGHVRDGIDIGTGTGVWAEVLTNYCTKVVAIDFAENNIKVARSNAIERNLSNRLSYAVGDAQRLQDLSDNSFDVATHISVLQHLPDRGQALRRVNDILRENGHLIILVHNKRCIYNKNFNKQRKQGVTIAINEYQTLGEIKDLLTAAGFHIESVRLSWLCVNDLLLLGIARPFLKPLMPLRKGIIFLVGWLDCLIGYFPSFNPLFREVVVLAKKSMTCQG